jgi:peptidylprolyl isomerase
MRQAQYGDPVKVHYTGILNDVTMIDTTHNHNPLQITLGEGKVIPRFEEVIIEMVQSESKAVNIKAFGPRKQALIIYLESVEFPSDFQPQIGQQLSIAMYGENEIKATVTVADISKTHIKVDANHLLAGRDLIVDLELVEIT